MSKALFEAAKELIAEKKYYEARAILKTIDHPKAREWERRLDVLDPISRALLGHDRIAGSVSYIRHPKWTVQRLAVNIIGIIIFFILTLISLAVYFPNLVPENRRQTQIVINRTQGYIYNSTQQAIHNMTEDARPKTATPTFTAAPNWEKTRAYWNTADAKRKLNDDQTRAANQTANALQNLAIQKTADAQRTILALTVTLQGTNTPVLSMNVTPLPRSTYYEVKEWGSFLKYCPRKDCEQHSPYATDRGQAVTVVGMVNNAGHNWYVVEVSANGRIHYEYALFEELSLFTPTPMPTRTPYTPPSDSPSRLFTLTPSPRP